MRIISIIFLLGQINLGYSQNRDFFLAVENSKFFPITIDPLFQDTLTFGKNWDYQAKVYKKDGELYDAFTESLANPEDTTHFFYTANILLNNSFKINYAFAESYNDILSLKFGEKDDLNPSLLKFYLTLASGQFRVDSVYMPLRLKYRHTFEVKSATLILKNLPLLTDTAIYGYLDILIHRKILITADDVRESENFIKGYFKIPISERTSTAANRQFCVSRGDE
ncbi:MAG: hypothetical protein U0U70_10835 [Chitinophagaceae bacterium]